VTICSFAIRTIERIVNSTDRVYTLGQLVGRLEDSVGLLDQRQIAVVEISAADVRMGILGLVGREFAIGKFCVTILFGWPG